MRASNGYQLRVLVLAIACALATACLHRSPVTRQDTSNEPLSGSQVRLRDELTRDVDALSVGIGPRHAGRSIEAVLEAERWITERLRSAGIEPDRDEIDVAGTVVANVVATLPGTKHPDEILLLGAHYDTVIASPGADDNASGVALLLALAVSDTSEFRNPNYHRSTDTIGTIDFDSMARMAEGWVRLVRVLANTSGSNFP